MSSQGIGFSTLSSWSIAYLEVVFCKFLGPTCLSGVQGLGCDKVIKVLMIGDYPDRLGSTNQLSTPFFKYNDDGEDFLVMDLIVAFIRGHTTTVEGNWVQEAFAIRVVLVLGEYSGYNVV